MPCKSTLAALLTTLAMMTAPAASGVASQPVSRAGPITAANWRCHPAIVAIRAIYREVLAAERAGRLRKEARVFEYCHAYDDGDRTLYLDAGGTARSYRTFRGSDDSAIQTAYTYDRTGALRFVLAKAAAINGTAYEYRIYLSRSGERLWEERRDLKGPGYTFPSQLPDDWLVRDPNQAFNAPNPCETP